MTAARARKRSRVSALLWLLIPAAAVLFVGANAHMVYVAIKSQPDCVAHLKQAGSGGQFRAAKSAC